jgi:hypothetical protein
MHWNIAELLKHEYTASYSQFQPVPASRLMLLRSRRAQAPSSWASNAWLANDAFYLINSAVFHCVEYH